MGSANTTEAADIHKDVVINPKDTKTLPHTYTAEQAEAVHTVMAAEQAEAAKAAGKHLAPLELHASEGYNHTVHIDEKRDGKVVGSDDIYSNGSIVHAATDKLGHVTKTQTDQSGHFIHSETDDQSGHKLSETQQYQGAKVTEQYDSQGKVISTTTEYPNGKDVETTDKLGNVTKNSYDGDGKLYHSDTHDKSGKLTREEFDFNGKKTVKSIDKDGKETDSSYENGKLTEQNYFDKNHHLFQKDVVDSDGSRTRYGYDAQGRTASYDWLDKAGKPMQHFEYDDKGRETRFVNYDHGKPDNETVTHYDDKTGGKTEVRKNSDHTASVRIYDKQGKYQEYDYDKNHQQNLSGEGNDKDGLTSWTDISSDPKWKDRPYSDQN